MHHAPGRTKEPSTIDFVTSQPPVQQRAERGQWTLTRATQLHEVRHALKKTVRAEMDLPDVVGRPLLAAAEERLSLVFSELGANALRYGVPPVAATLARGVEDWLITVSDGDSHSVPQPREPSPDQEGGRGLHLVAAMSGAYGWYVRQGCKHVWAVIADQPPADLLATLQHQRNR